MSELYVLFYVMRPASVIRIVCAYVYASGARKQTYHYYNVIYYYFVLHTVDMKTKKKKVTQYNTIMSFVDRSIVRRGGDGSCVNMATDDAIATDIRTHNGRKSV